MKQLKKVSDAALSELNRASAPFDHLPTEERERLLQEHQANKLNAIKALGVINALSLESREPTYVDLELLAKARQEIREASTPEGAAKRISAPIASQVMKSWPKKPPSPRFDPQEIFACLKEVIRKHGTKKVMANSVSWIVDRVVYEWEASHNAEEKCPSANTIRPVIEDALPQHPKIMKKSCKKAVN